ncbi:large ribosomal subunit protein mL53 isoform X2 [Anabrus simplex]|uniref:large ribosomal subunit protein mL53 isoform X2 n=1 Tax=Anabrus simplex TaxID=316456 RepID=UPI0035A292DC
MSIPFSGTFTRSAGLISAIAKQLRSITLKPIKKLTITFDPFDSNGNHTRFLFYISSQKILSTNPSCKVKTDIVCNRAEPSVFCSLVNGESVLLKSGNLTALELLQLFNKHITPLAPPEDTSKVLVTKSEKSSKTAKRRR